MQSILIVDDDELIRSILKTLLASFEVIEACNGIKAIELFETFNPDLVLMDIIMAGMDGIEATKRILSLNPSATVLGISAYSLVKGQEMIAAGAKEVISKPIKSKVLLGKILEYLRME